MNYLVNLIVVYCSLSTLRKITHFDTEVHYIEI